MVVKIKFILPVLLLFVIVSSFGQSNPKIDSLNTVLKTAINDTLKVKNLNLLCQQYIDAKDYEMALNIADSALVLADRLDYQKGKLFTFFKIGRMYVSQNNFLKALEYFSNSLKICEETGDKQKMAQIHNNVGLTKRILGNYPEALENFSAILKIAEALGDKNSMYNAYNNIGIIYSEQGNFPKALDNYFTAISIKEEMQDKSGMYNSYNNIGIAYQNQGKYPEALENYFACLRIVEENGFKQGIAYSYNNIAGVYYFMEYFDDALENTLASLKIREEIGDKKGIADCYHSMGLLYERQVNYPEALKNHLTALKIREEIGYKKGIAYSYSNIGSINKTQKNYQEALENYMSSLKIYEELEDKGSIIGVYINLGSVNTYLTNFQEARKLLDKALVLSEEIGNTRYIKDSYKTLSILDSLEGKFDLALEHYKMYTLHKDSLVNERSNIEVSRLKIQYETEKKDKEIELLNKDNEIKELLLNQQRISLIASRLSAEKSNSLIQLLDNEREIQGLKLAESQLELEHQHAKAKVKANELAFLKKDKEIQEHHLENQKLLRNGMIAGIILMGLLTLFVFQSFKLRKKLEQEKAITLERKRISADLHDDVGSGLSRIMLLSEMVKKVAKMPETRKEAEKISMVSQKLSSNISEIIWALNSNNDYVENMVAYIRRYAAEYFENAEVQLKIKTPDNISDRPISSEKRRNVFYTIKEALHNIIKHAKATQAELNFELKNDVLTVLIYDNGIGIPKGEVKRFGNGIPNMKNRIKSIKGELIMENYNGTKVTLSVPV